MINEFINTFEKGMFSDTNIVLQPDGTYRFMKNCQLINQDNNNYVVKDCLGNLVTFQLNPIYDAVYTVVQDVYPMPIGFISFPNELVVFSTVNASDDGRTGSVVGGIYGEIGLVRYEPYGQGVQPKSVAGQYNAGYIPLYHHEELYFTWQKRIEGFAFRENNLINRVYWTDNLNEPRVFNITDPIFTTYIPDGSIVSGTFYMVLEGAIEYPVGSGQILGPGLNSGNVFEGTGLGNYTNLTGTSPTPKVIEYYPIELLSWTPSRKLGTITFDEYGQGSLICGAKVYYYRLSNDDGTPPTFWSYGSYPIPVGTQNDYISGNRYHDFVGAGTTIATFNSRLSVKILIENIDTNFKYIEVACSEFDQLIDAPRQTTIIAKLEITGTEMTVEHDGNVNLGNLVYPTDFTTFPASILKVKTLATSKNYNIPGNITERGELTDWDLSGVTLSQFEYPMNVHMDADSCSLSGMIYTGVSPTSGANPGAGTITPFSRWLVTVGEAAVNTVTYNGTLYLTGETIIGVTGAGNDTITFAGTGAVRPCHFINKYDTSGGDPRPRAIEIKNNGLFADTCFLDYRSAAASHCVGYWSGEKYPYAIVAIDHKGIPFAAKHIGFYTFDNINTKGGLIRTDIIGNTGNLVYSLNPSGLQVDNIVIPPEIINKMSGFMIVRGIRNPRIVMQGLVTQNTTNGATPAVYRPGAWIPVSLDGNAAVASATYSGIFPDVLVDCPMKASVGQIGDTMESAFWVDPYNYGPAGVRVRGSGPAASEQVYSKIITPLSGDTTLRSQYITFWEEADELETLSNLGSGVTFTNTMTTAAAAVTVNGDCVAVPGNYTLNAHQAVGGKKIFFKLNADFLHYGPSANGYSSTAAAAQTEKIVMNYVKTGITDQYPGPIEDILYISTGHYQPITDAVKGDVLDGGSGNYIFNNVQVFGGDCFPSLVDYGYGLWNSDYANKYSYAWTFPCECNSNYNLRRGRKTSNVEMWYTGIATTSDAIVYKNGSTVHLEDFSYNQGYSAENFAVSYVSLPDDFTPVTEFEFRERRSLQKVIGESIDSFRIFPISNYLDLDGAYGKINNNRVRDGVFFIWQDKAVCTAPILERQIVSSSLGDPTTLGTGGVLDRFDLVDTYFGNKHQWGLTNTEFGFIWFDMERKAVIEMRSNGGVNEISQILGLQNFFNQAFLEVVGSALTAPETIINAPSFTDTPLVGYGITGTYDPKLKMTYLTFKYKERKLISGTAAYYTKDFTIGFLHSNTDTMFVGFFDWFPSISHTHNQMVLSASNPKNTTQFLQNPGSLPVSTSFVIGETLQGQDNLGNTNNVQYICIQNVTLDNAAKYPLGASGSTYWAPVFQTNYLHVLNQPAALGQATAPDYVYNKFDGIVVNNQIDVVVNPGKGTIGSFYAGSYKQVGPHNVNYTTITVSAPNQTGQDASIRSTDRNYRFVYDGIEANSPRDSRGARIINKYNLFQFIKKNWTSDPRVITTSVKILEKLVSRFTRKF